MFYVWNCLRGLFLSSILLLFMSFHLSQNSNGTLSILKFLVKSPSWTLSFKSISTSNIPPDAGCEGQRLQWSDHLKDTWGRPSQSQWHHYMGNIKWLELWYVNLQGHHKAFSTDAAYGLWPVSLFIMKWKVSTKGWKHSIS